MCRSRGSILFLLSCVASALAQEPAPVEWIDADTGHRVVRLSREPGSESLYFHQNAFTASGDKMVITTPGGISTVNLKTREVELVVPDARFSTNQGSIVVGRVSRQVYYTRRVDSNTVIAFATHLDTKETRRIGQVPGRGTTVAVNADETLLAGTLVDTAKQSDSALATLRKGPQESKGEWMQRRFAARLPMQLFTLDIKTGKARTFHPSTDWLNHLQFSPTDPTLLLFCHEGPWHWL
ncbi:MAG: oligogalacturonate lyase, partial [Akkermansiaceae bacterium]|nr:oligogalacturonate lyase [Verrucomicrobiales bacterium]